MADINSPLEIGVTTGPIPGSRLKYASGASSFGALSQGFTIYAKVLIAAAAMIAMPASLAASPLRLTEYRTEAGNPSGYRDYVMHKPERWGALVLIHQAGKSETTAIALYRLALHARKAGFEAMDIVDAEYIDNSNFANGSGQIERYRADVRAIGAHPEEPVHACDADRRFRSSCRRIFIAQILPELQQILGLTDADTVNEIAQLPS